MTYAYLKILIFKNFLKRFSLADAQGNHVRHSNTAFINGSNTVKYIRLHSLITKDIQLHATYNTRGSLFACISGLQGKGGNLQLKTYNIRNVHLFSLK